MTQWTTFAGLTAVVCVLLLVLSHATKTALTESESEPAAPNSSHHTDSSTGAVVGDQEGERKRIPDSSDDFEPRSASGPGVTDVSNERDTREDDVDRERRPGDSNPGAERRVTEGETVAEPAAAPVSVTKGERGDEPAPGRTDQRPLAESMSSGALLANVALSQGLFATLLIGAAVYAEIPADALRIGFTRGYLVDGVLYGTALGAGLYVANEVGSVGASRLGIDHDEELRGLLAPDSLGGWLLLLGVVLPTIAIFEEFLFRAALIGTISTGFGVSPWLLAVVSSIAFALGHGMQGPAGIVVTGALGLVLAGAFVFTNSFLVVVVAHYLINALEFVVHEGLGLEWTAPKRSSG